MSTTFLRAAALAIALLTACGGSDGGEAGDNAAPSTAAPTTAAPTTEAAPSSTEATTTTTTESATTTTEAPAAALELLDVGAYDVGVTTVTVDEGSERPLTVDVWFPIADGSALAPHQYTFIPGIYYESPVAVTADPTTDAADGSFPLVVYSHGSGGQRFIHSDYTETIASHGYVVVAPDHTGNTVFERLAGGDYDVEAVARDRPRDVISTLDDVLDASTSAGAVIAPMVTDDPVVVTGHSFGGFTSYATVSGFTTPSGGSEPDDRVGGVITLAPAASEALLSDELLAAVDVPHLVIVGTDDATTPIDPNVDRPWNLAVGRPAYRVELVAGEHQTFTDVCAYSDFLPNLTAVPEAIVAAIDTMGEAGCSPDDMPIERAHALTNTFTVRFLDELYRSGEATIPKDVTLPDDIITAVLP